MTLSKMKLKTVLGGALAALLPLVFAGQADAAPPEGMRWSDTAWGNRGASPARGMPSAGYRPSYSQPRYFSPPRAYAYPALYAYVSPATPTAVQSVEVASTAAPAAPTVAIRGPDGVVRSFPVDPGAVQQQAATPNRPAYSFVNILGPDGVVRSFPVETAPAATAAPVVVNPGVTWSFPVMTSHCR
jgi:hypothetical protein